MVAEIPAILLSQTKLANGFVQATFKTPCAEEPKPGQYIFLNKQPFYIMGATATEITVILNEDDKLAPTSLISTAQGQPLPLPNCAQFMLLLAENHAISATIFYLQKYRQFFKGLVLLGTTNKFPFKPCPSRKIIYNAPAGVIAALPLLEDWGIANRLASTKDLPGAFQGTVAQLSEILAPNANILPIPALY